MTYNSLTAQMIKYLNRADTSTVDEIPTFISNAEQRICRECETVGLEQYVVGKFIPGTAVYPKPGRWRRNISMNFGSGINDDVRSPIVLRVYEYLVKYWPNRTETGVPKFYSDYGYSNILIAPTPDADYPFEWAYLELPQPLSPTVQTNWLTNYAPDALLYATLLEAMPYLKNDTRLPIWQNLYDRSLASLKHQDSERIFDRGSKRDSD